MSKTQVSPDVLQRIKKRLQETYGDRLKGVLLYGSEARGEAGEDSDIDLLVLLDGPVKALGDLRTIVDTLYPIRLEITRHIHAIPAEYAAYRVGELLLYRDAGKDGVLL